MEQLKLLVIIVDRDKVDKVSESISSQGASFCHICYGKGTAKNDLLNLLGLGETKKGIIFSSVTDHVLKKIYTELKDKYDFEKPGSGISFSIPLTAVGGPASLKILQG